MNGFALIATHHKTGSVWMGRVFRAIATELEIPFFKTAETDLSPALPSAPPMIVFSNHSDFGGLQGLLDHPDSRILHLIRDPRDVIVSGMHYHLGAGERWLHSPDPEFGGMTYQEKLNSWPDDHSRYVFEMRHGARRTIEQMCSWNYQRPNAMECRYEQLIEDVEMKLFTRILAHLGFTPSELDSCRKQFWKRSLFGKAKNIKPGHVRSGEPRQWPEVFDRQLAREFVTEYPDALIQLGYEPDNSWVLTRDLATPASSMG